MNKYSLCTLSLALAMALNPGAALAQSHCKGLDEQRCSNSTACRWVPEREPAFGVSKRKAHCRLDIKAAANLAAKLNSQPK